MTQEQPRPSAHEPSTEELRALFCERNSGYGRGLRGEGTIGENNAAKEAFRHFVKGYRAALSSRQEAVDALRLAEIGLANAASYGGRPIPSLEIHSIAAALAAVRALLAAAGSTGQQPRYRLWIDQHQYEWNAASITGAQIKALAIADPSFGLWESRPNEPTDPPTADDESVDLRGAERTFFTGRKLTAQGQQPAGEPRADFVPNILRCAKCNFELERLTLNANTGAVGIGTNEPERCPNGCGPLWRVTWKQEARYLGKRLNEWADRAIAAEKSLAERPAAPVLSLVAPAQSLPAAAPAVPQPTDQGQQHHWRCITCGATTESPLTDESRCDCKDIYDQQWIREGGTPTPAQGLDAKDAARWRWLASKEFASFGDEEADARWANCFEGDKDALDAAIDEAMSRSTTP